MQMSSRPPSWPTSQRIIDRQPPHIGAAFAYPSMICSTLRDSLASAASCPSSACRSVSTACRCIYGMSLHPVLHLLQPHADFVHYSALNHLLRKNEIGRISVDQPNPFSLRRTSNTVPQSLDCACHYASTPSTILLRLNPRPGPLGQSTAHVKQVMHLHLDNHQ